MRIEQTKIPYREMCRAICGLARPRLLRSREFSLCSLVTIEKVGESKPSNF